MGFSRARPRETPDANRRRFADARAVASRAQQKQRRRAEQVRVTVARTRRTRLLWLAAIVVAAVAAIAVTALSSGGSKPAPAAAAPSALRTVRGELTGISQSGATLGSPTAPVTVTEYGDLVCPTCAVFATTTEPQLIASEVRTGKVKLVFRGLETASSAANGAAYDSTMLGIRSAGLQDRAWWYVLLAYAQQPQTIGGRPAEDVPYVTTAYLQHLAAQIPGLDAAAWQAHLVDPALLGAVRADSASAATAGIDSTPTLVFSGPRGTVEYNRDGSLSAIPTLAQMQQLIASVS